WDNKKTDPETPGQIELRESLDRIFDNSLQEIIPNQEFLYCFFEFGSIPPEILENAIDGCRFFYDEQTPSWKRLWHVWDLSDSDFEKYYVDVLEKFKAFEY